MKKFISALLLLVLLLTVFTGCDKGKTDDPVTPTKPQIKKTDITIVDNGLTDYRVVVPSGASRDRKSVV